MNEHKAVPNIRFRNFKDEWTKKKISNFIIKNSDKNKNLVIKNIESISNKTGFTKQSEQFDGYRVASQDISNYYVISPNQFAYNPSRINVGSIAYKKKGEDKSIISPLYISFSTSSHINDSFLWFWFKTTSFKKQRIQFSEGGVRDTLPFENLKKMEISSPLLQEQKKIGDFFTKLGKLLDLQQQKIDKLELLKKALLQKLFPKHDTKIPELRYREFEDNWIIYSFSGLLIKNSSKNKNLEVENIESISNKNGFTKQSEQFDGYRVASLDLSNYYVIKGNQFAYNPSRINVGSIAYKRKGEEDSIISPLYVSFSTKNNINDTFLWYWFRTSSFKKQRIQFSEGGVRDTLPFENLKKMRIKLPRLNEQQKIGNLLSKVDQLIELENKKLQNFQQLKKCLLQNMFVE